MYPELFTYSSSKADDFVTVHLGQGWAPDMSSTNALTASVLGVNHAVKTCIFDNHGNPGLVSLALHHCPNRQTGSLGEIDVLVDVHNSGLSMVACRLLLTQATFDAIPPGSAALHEILWQCCLAANQLLAELAELCE